VYCSKATNLYPGITRFRGILSLIQSYIFEIYVKFCVFLIPIMRGVEKKFFGPSYVPVRFLAASRGRAHVIAKKIFCRFLHVLHQNETTAG
jgi:hypothetical protein